VKILTYCEKIYLNEKRTYINYKKMAEENKKISFGFAKSVKKPILGKQKLHQEKKVDYIECLDDKAIKVIG